MKQILQDLLGSLFERLLGCDGMAAAALLSLGVWCGHYAVRGYRSRPAELVLLVPISLASFAGAVSVCESVPKLLGLLILSLLAYFLTVNRRDAAGHGR